MSFFLAPVGLAHPVGRGQAVDQYADYLETESAARGWISSQRFLAFQQKTPSEDGVLKFVVIFKPRAQR